jgi:hypothetical protein
MADSIQLTDLDVITRYSIAVRKATADRADLIETLRADLAWLERGVRRAPAPLVEAEPAEEYEEYDEYDEVEESEEPPPRAPIRRMPAKVTPVRKAPARKTAAKKTTAKKATSRRTAR